MNSICSHCTIVCNLNSRKKIKSLIKGDPKVIYVLPHPDFEDDQGNYFCGEKGSFIVRALEKAGVRDNYILTFMIKCFPTIRAGYIPTPKSREPTQKDYKYCIPYLLEELEDYPNAIIQTFGKATFTFLTGMDTYLDKVGIDIKFNLNCKERVVVPNFDPSYLYRKGNLFNDFINNIKRCFSSFKKPNFNEIVEILSYDRAMEEVDKTISLYKRGKITHVYHDIENSISLLPWEGGAITVHAFCHDNDPKAFAVPLEINNELRFKVSSGIERVSFSVTEIQRAKLNAKFGELLNTVPVVGHNYKYDARWLIWNNIVDINKIKVHADTMIMGFMLVNFDKTHGLGLEDLAVRLLYADPWEFVVKDYLKNFNLIKDRHYGNIPTGLICPYACRDVFWVRALYQFFKKNVPPCSNDILKTITSSIHSFLEIETKGIRIDNDMYIFLKDNYRSIQNKVIKEINLLPRVKAIVEKYKAPLVEENAKKRKKLSDEELNKKAFSIGSVPKIREILFDFYKLTPNKNFKTKKANLQTGKDVIDYYLTNDLRSPQTKIEKEAKQFLIAIKLWKRIEKLYTAYINSLPTYINNDIYRPDYALSFVTTGRLSSVFHVMPNGCDIKRLFISRWRDEGGLILACDYSQLELRVVAALAGESKFIEGFKNGIDAHKNSASLVYNKPADKISNEERQVGKKVNFAILFRMAAKSLAFELNKTEEEAQIILNKFYNGADRLKRWQNAQIKFGLENGYIETVFGRRIPIKTYLSTLPRERAESERVCVNYPVQSAASDIVLNSSLSIYNNKKKLDLKSIYIGCVHDSIEYDVYPGELIKLINLITKNAVDRPRHLYPWLTCPLEMSFELGTSWGGALECEIQHISEDEVILIAEGLTKDCRLLESTLRKAYDVSVELVKETQISSGFFSDDILFRDSSRKKVKVSVKHR